MLTLPTVMLHATCSLGALTLICMYMLRKTSSQTWWCSATYTVWAELLGHWASTSSRRTAPFTLPFANSKVSCATKLCGQVVEFWQAVTDSLQVRLALTTVQVHCGLELVPVQEHREGSQHSRRSIFVEKCCPAFSAEMPHLTATAKRIDILLALDQLDVRLLIRLVWID